MALYLSPYVGLGTHDTPFFPRGLDEPGASAIDLRHDCTTRDGMGMRYGLLWLPDDIPAPIGAKKLATDHGEPASKVAKQHCEGLRCHVDFSKDKNIEDVVSTLLLRPAKGHWSGLRPSRGVVEAWLGSSSGLKRWVHLPVIAGMTTRTDDFNRADENPLAGNWSGPTTSLYKIVSNQLVGQNSGDDDNYQYWNADVFPDDQFSQIQLVTYAGPSPGVTVRGSGATRNYYAYQTYAGPTSEIFKYVSGGYTVLVQASVAWNVGEYVKLVAEGTTLTCYLDANNPPATQILQVTDTTFTGGVPGIYNYFGNANVLDNWSGGDLVSAGTSVFTVTLRHRRRP